RGTSLSPSTASQVVTLSMYVRRGHVSSAEWSIQAAGPLASVGSKRAIQGRRAPERSRAFVGREPSMLQNLLRVIAEPRALAALERHMARVRPALEAIDDVRDARAALGQVWRVDLRDVAEAHDLRTGSRACHHCLHLLGRQVLRLVDDQELVDERA